MKKVRIIFACLIMCLCTCISASYTAFANPGTDLEQGESTSEASTETKPSNIHGDSYINMPDIDQHMSWIAEKIDSILAENRYFNKDDKKDIFKEYDRDNDKIDDEGYRVVTGDNGEEKRIEDKDKEEVDAAIDGLWGLFGASTDDPDHDRPQTILLKKYIDTIKHRNMINIVIIAVLGVLVIILGTSTGMYIAQSNRRRRKKPRIVYSTAEKPIEDTVSNQSSNVQKKTNGETLRSNTSNRQPTGNNSALKNENAKLKREKQELERVNEKLKQNNSKLDNGIKQLKEENSKLKEEKEHLENTNAILKQDNSELNNENKQLKEENSKLKVEKQELERVNVTSEDKIQKLESKVKELSKALAEKPIPTPTPVPDPTPSPAPVEPVRKYKLCGFDTVNGGVKFKEGELVKADITNPNIVKIYATDDVKNAAVRSKLMIFFNYEGSGDTVNTVKPCIVEKTEFNYTIKEKGKVKFR